MGEKTEWILFERKVNYRIFSDIEIKMETGLLCFIKEVL